MLPYFQIKTIKQNAGNKCLRQGAMGVIFIGLYFDRALLFFNDRIF